MNLTHNAQDVRAVIALRVLDAWIRRIRSRSYDGLVAGVREAIANHADRAVHFQRLHQLQPQIVLPIPALHALHLLKLLRNGQALELDEVRPIQSGLRVETFVCIADAPTGAIQTG